MWPDRILKAARFKEGGYHPEFKIKFQDTGIEPQPVRTVHNTDPAAHLMHAQDIIAAMDMEEKRLLDAIEVETNRHREKIAELESTLKDTRTTRGFYQTAENMLGVAGAVEDEADPEKFDWLPNPLTRETPAMVRLPDGSLGFPPIKDDVK